jgi:hypothetical protein
VTFSIIHLTGEEILEDNEFINGISWHKNIQFKYMRNNTHVFVTEKQTK